MIGQEVLDVIAANPGLPVYALVGEEVCNGDTYWGFAPYCRVSVEEIVRESEIDDERLWIRSCDEEYMIEQHACSNEYAGYAEAVRLAQEHVEDLPWERCVILWLER